LRPLPNPMAVLRTCAYVYERPVSASRKIAVIIRFRQDAL
jgi:hypothetical protein